MRGKFGIRLLESAAANDMVIGDLLFHHPKIQKQTRYRLHGFTRTVIDHVLINSNWQSMVIDIGVRSNDELDTHHWLLLTKVPLQLCRQTMVKMSLIQLKALITTNLSSGFLF